MFNLTSFQGGNLTRERILVVFFFCSDVALFALQNHTVNLFCKLIQWSTDYVTGRLSQFICSQGGWVIDFNFLTFSCAAFLIQYLTITDSCFEQLHQHFAQNISYSNMLCSNCGHAGIYSKKLEVANHL